MKQLDFLVIGTQKGGTKVFYEYLRQHPQLFLPYAMEIGFFALDSKYEKGVDWYLKEFFGDAPDTKLWGEVSPQYMSRTRSAGRIRCAFPRVRLIASLRNPVDRAFSAFRMMVSRSLERRSFEEVVNALEWGPDKSAPRSRRDELLDDFEYLRVGLYGHILGEYLSEFPADQIKVIFAENLKSDVESNFREVLDFVGADSSILPANLGGSYHEGGEPRLPWVNAFFESDFYRIVSAPIKPLVPKRARNLVYRVQQLNKRASEAPALDPELRMRLRDMFRDDVSDLERQFGLLVPWQEFHQ